MIIRNVPLTVAHQPWETSRINVNHIFQHCHVAKCATDFLNALSVLLGTASLGDSFFIVEECTENAGLFKIQTKPSRSVTIREASY